MKREEFFEYCFDKFGTTPDSPFNKDFETSVFRHTSNGKWFAICMKVSRRKFGFFGADVGIYPAYHMNKLHWILVLLPDSPEEILRFLTEKSFEATEGKLQ